MELLIMRHGEAVYRPGPDADRELSLVGESQVARMAQHLSGEINCADLVLVSPLLRACQTAAIMLQGSRQHAQQENNLQPESSPQRMADLLQGVAGERTWLICHMPLAGALVDWLVDASRSPVTSFDTAEVICLQAAEWLPGCARLAWRKNPRDIYP